MPKVKLNDIHVYYEIYGEGTPIIFISGLGGDHYAWLPVAEILSQQHYQVIVFDNRGVGQTDIPQGPYTGKQMAADTIALMDALKIDRAHIVGNSMGGMITQYIGIHYPNRAIKLVLDSTIAKISARLKFFNSTILQILQQTDFPTLMQMIVLYMFTANFFEDNAKVANFLELVASNPYPLTATGLQGQINLCDNHDTTEQLSKITNPCLVLAGDADLLVPSTNSNQIATSIPNATLKIFSNASHCWYIEDPASYCKELMAFLNS